MIPFLGQHRRGRSGYPAATQDFHPSTSVRAGDVAMAQAVRQAHGKPKSQHCNVAWEAIKEDKQLCEFPSAL